MSVGKGNDGESPPLELKRAMGLLAVETSDAAREIDCRFSVYLELPAREGAHDDDERVAPILVIRVPVCNRIAVHLHTSPHQMRAGLCARDAEGGIEHARNVRRLGEQRGDYLALRRIDQTDGTPGALDSLPPAHWPVDALQLVDEVLDEKVAEPLQDVDARSHGWAIE